MKVLGKLMAIVCLALAVGLIADMVLPAGAGMFPSAQAASKVKLNKSKIRLCVGDTYRLKVSGTKREVTWSSSNKRVAKVNKKGLVTALKAGEARITAKVGKKKYTCKVVVRKCPAVEPLPFDPTIIVVKKPILYLYPEADMELTVTLGRPEALTTSYPAYGDGWRVLAHPDGTLEDLNTGRSLYALYWEGQSQAVPPMDEGFVVAGADAAAFLEEKLALLGLTEREAEEFIVYWLPNLQENPYNLIRFMTVDEIDAAMPLAFSTEPDALIRVYMLYRPLEEPADVPEQALPETPTRAGFTAVEWGGSEVG